MMEDTLRKFLQDHETEERVWFEIPSGIVYGELQKLESQEPEMIILKRAFAYAGGIPVEAATLMVRVSRISAWGDDIEVWYR